MTDQQQARFSQNQMASSPFFMASLAITNEFTGELYTDWALSVLFIYLWSNMCKKKMKNNGDGEENLYPNLGRSCDFSFPSLEQQGNGAKAFHFDTPRGRTGTDLVPSKRGRASC